MLNNISKIKKEARKKFVLPFGSLDKYEAQELYSFIEQALLTQRREIIKEIEGMKRDYLDVNPVKGEHDEDRCSLCGGLISDDYDFDTCDCLGYNQALDDICKKIKNE